MRLRKPDEQETANRPVSDDRLRAEGFIIWGRPEKGQPVWKRDGKLYKQSEAEKLLTDPGK